MKITVIGAGAIGGNLAARLSRAGHDVLVADARGPAAVVDEVTAAGAKPVVLEDAVEDRDVVIIAVPFGAQPDLAELIRTAPESAVIVDTSNYYPGMNGHIPAVVEGQVESMWSQEQLGRPIVKAWNAALAATQKTMAKPSGAEGRIAIPVAGDSEDARSTVMQLVDDTGFDAVDAGVLANSWRQQPGTPAYCTELNYLQLAQALDAADKDRAPAVRDELMQHFGALEKTPSREETVVINRSAHR